VEQRSGLRKIQNGYIGFQDHGSNYPLEMSKSKNFKNLIDEKKRFFKNFTGSWPQPPFYQNQLWPWEKQQTNSELPILELVEWGVLILSRSLPIPDVVVVGLCDVDSNAIAKAGASHPNAKTYKDYRVMLKEMASEIDAVVVSTPDHTHAPASIMAMEMNKPVYCQKPLAHHVSEVRAMRKIAEEKNLVTQMGIQVHSFYDYKLATLLIQSGIIGKVSRVRAWSPKNWGYDGPKPTGSDQYLPIWTGIFGWAPPKNAPLKKKFTIPETGENWSTLVVEP
jgi:hypothetical protein